MGVLHVWPLWLLLLIPIIIVLYLLKQKAEDKQVSSLFLWRELYQNNEVIKAFEKFKNNLLMYLEIAAILFLVFALCAPYLKNRGTEYKNLVLILDNSGSMNTYYEKDKTRLEVAKEKMIDYMEQYGKRSHITILSSNQKAQLELGNSNDSTQIKKAISRIKSTDLEGDIEQAIRLAESFSSQWDSYETVVFTDNSVNMGSLNGSVVFINEEDSISDTSVNAAVDYVSYSIGAEGELTVLAKISNYGFRSYQSELNLYMNDTIVDIQPISLEVSNSEFVYFEPIKTWENGENTVLKVELQQADALLSDNIAYTQVGEQAIKKVLLVTEKNIFLEKAILTNPNVELYKTNSVENMDSSQQFDLTIFDGIEPEKLPEYGNVILFYKVGTLFGETKEISGTWIKTKQHKVTNYLEEFQFGVNEAIVMDTPNWAESFLTTEEEDAKKSVGFIGNWQGRTVAALGIDIHQSDLPLQTEFPILIYNLLSQCLEHNFLSSQTITTGEQIFLYGEEKTVSVTYPDGTKQQVDCSNANSYFDDTSQAGIYTFKGKETEHLLAVNFPTSESKLFTNQEIASSTHTKTVTADSIKSGVSIKNSMIILAMILLLLELIVYFHQTVFRKKRKKYINLIFRISLLLFLFLSLFEFQFRFGQGKITTIFLADVSDSVSAWTTKEEDMLKTAIKELPKKEQAAVIAFGQNTKVEQFVTDKTVFQEFQTTPLTTSTNLEQAVQSALALFPAEDAKRLVLITDGKENEGSLKNMIPILAANDISFQVMKLEEETEAENYISSVKVPDKVDLNDMFQVEVLVESNVKTSAVLHLYSGNELKGSTKVELETGTNRFLLKDKQTNVGLKSYRVVLESEQDTKSINNEYLAFTEATKGDYILVIEGAPKEADEFVKVLKAANINYERINPASAPKTVLDMNTFQVIITVDVYSEDLPKKFLDNLESYVKDYAGGFIAIGGENSFALGKYRDTSLETVLPVYMDLQGEKEIPETAMALVIDHSGSMSNGNRYITMLDLAKEAACSALDSLRKTDSLGVLSFDDTYDWVVPIQKADNKESMEDAIYSIALGGGTSIYPAIEQAYEKLEESNAKVKHILLLTDGQDGFHEYEDLLKKINDANMTLSTVAVGQGADTATLQELAEQGKGRFYYTDINSDIPRIFSQEVFLSTNTYLINREFTPAIASNSDILNGIAQEGLPPLLGYIGASSKELATTILVSDTGDPILTTWQYGLGKTAAFNSDVTNEWTAYYANWENYPALWKNLIQWCTTDTSGGENNVTITQSANTAHVVYTAQNYDSDTIVSAVYTDEEGKETELVLEATKPGVFEGDLELLETGVYSVNVRQQDNNQIINRNTAVALQYSPEYRFYEKSDILEQAVSQLGGKFLTSLTEVYDINMMKTQERRSITIFLLCFVIGLFFMEIVNRRLGVVTKALTFVSGKIQKRTVQKKEKQIQKETISQIPKQQEESKKEEEPKKESKVKKQQKEKKQEKKKAASERLDTSNLLNKKKERNQG